MKQNRRYQIGNLLRAVSAVLGSDLAQPADDVCLHLLKRPKQLVKPLCAHGRSELEKGAAGKRRAAKGSVALYQTLAMMLVVPGATGEGLRQATHHVTGALVEHTQRGSKSRVFITFLLAAVALSDFVPEFCDGLRFAASPKPSPSPSPSSATGGCSARRRKIRLE